VASLVIREDNGLAKTLQLRPIRRIGQISYGIYLYHLFALVIVEKSLALLGIGNMAIWFLGYYGVAVAISEFSFRTYEAWFLRRQKR